MPYDLQAALEGSPYLLDESGAQKLEKVIKDVNERVGLLRSTGRLTADTLRRYYGSTRYEQIAESNALEGSTLSVGETEIAVSKGVTLTGHDPGYIRDAVALNKALNRITELAQEHTATNMEQLKELHELILEGRNAAGQFRNVPVRISGSAHRPPATWREVMDQMESWELWSREHGDLPAPIRAIVLHAWLAHIHPFVDGNGRTARAITNLELVRAGYPPLIIRKRQDRERYINALQASDSGGDIGPFAELLLDRCNAALVGLEGAAREMESYNPQAIRIQRARERTLSIWNSSVSLLYSIICDRLFASLDGNAEIETTLYSESWSLDEYVQLCEGYPISRSWAFRVVINVPGLPPVDRLAWIGYRSDSLKKSTKTTTSCPSLFWSERNPTSYPPWIQVDSTAPGLRELSNTPGEGDDWHALTSDGGYRSLSTTQAAQAIVDGLVNLLTR